MAKYVVVSNVKKLAALHGRRVGADFLLMLDAFVEKKVAEASQTHNGGKITLDASVAGWVGIKK